MQCKVTVGKGSTTPLPDGMQYELDVLWKAFEREKNLIIMEEMDKEYIRYPDVDEVYYEDYVDHWRVEHLREDTYAAEDEIYRRYGY